MSLNAWNKYCKHLIDLQNLGITIDPSKMNFEEDLFSKMSPKYKEALSDMRSLEKGEIANPDEERMVGHYWLRAPELAPHDEIKLDISKSIDEVQSFAKSLHSGEILGQSNTKFKNVLMIGIGGSALGPQLLRDALGSSDDRMGIYFCDNTDPDGMFRLFEELESELSETLCIVISKSGGTVETKNGMLETKAFFESKNLSFEKQAVAVTCEGSKLDNLATENNWLKRFHMWDWVGGRTSIFSQVGLLPAALQGLDIKAFLEGAKDMDIHTREDSIDKNPALLLATMWHHGTGGIGAKDMVVLPYKDRLVLFSKYLQQLVMESLGKKYDLDGKIVHQGISVYGNKGSTDQHAYVQQLRDGVNNFFVTFIEVLENVSPQTTKAHNISVAEGDISSGDYLHGFYLGTRQALYESNRESISISLNRLDEKSLGALIALFERAVSFYASFVNINAYHQPGVEAGKKAATAIIELQKSVMKAMSNLSEGEKISAEELATTLNVSEQTESVYRILSRGVQNNIFSSEGKKPEDRKFFR